MIRTLPDGTIVEIGWGSTLPPGASGQHTNVNRVWYRLSGDRDWKQTNHRNLHKLLEWIDCCENLADFLSGETG